MTRRAKVGSEILDEKSSPYSCGQPWCSLHRQEQEMSQRTATMAGAVLSGEAEVIAGASAEVGAESARGVSVRPASIYS